MPESDNVVSIYITGRDLDKLPARAGQFFLWRFLTKDRWWQANPFSLSAAPDGTGLRLTAKAAGEGTAALRHIKVGTRVFAEGPYGAFTAMHRTRPESVLIAGGVGVTPIRALLEEIARPRGGHLPGRPPTGTPSSTTSCASSRSPRAPNCTWSPGRRCPTGWRRANWRGWCRTSRERDVFLCGPPPMMNAVLRHPARAGRAQAADPLRALQPGGMRNRP